MEADETTLTVEVHVKPGSSRVAVGGRQGEALIVAVSARAVSGAATEAALRALAVAFGLKRRQISLRSGATSRAKVVELIIDPPDRSRVEDLLARLLDQPPKVPGSRRR